MKQPPPLERRNPQRSAIPLSYAEVSDNEDIVGVVYSLEGASITNYGLLRDALCALLKVDLPEQPLLHYGEGGLRDKPVIERLENVHGLLFAQTQLLQMLLQGVNKELILRSDT